MIHEKSVQLKRIIVIEWLTRWTNNPQRRNLCLNVAFEIQCGSDFLLLFSRGLTHSFKKKKHSHQCIQLPLNERPFVDCLTHFNRKQRFKPIFIHSKTVYENESVAFVFVVNMCFKTWASELINENQGICETNENIEEKS